MKKFFVNLPEILLLILVLATPIQLGKHFWPKFSQVLGLRIDFLAPTIFFTDILIALFIGSAVIKVVITGKTPPKSFTFGLTLFLLANLISLIFSENQILSLWFWAKLIEFTSFTLAVSALNFSQVYSKIGQFFAIAAIAASVLATAQFWQQSSVGFWMAGERSFNLTTPQIAKIDFAGSQMLRPYATFPHPNVLGGFLSLSILIILFSSFARFTKFAILAILSLGLFLTFSRSAWLGLAFALIGASAQTFSWQKLFKGIIAFLLVVGLLLLIFPQNPISSRFWQVGQSDTHSLVLRAKLAQSAVKMFLAAPVTGAGPGNFLPNLPKFWDYEEDIRFLQPVHNIPLLVLAETGVIGAIALVFLLWTTFVNFFKNFKKMPIFLLPAWIVIFLISAFDHYFWTLQQGQILFWLILGLTWIRPPVPVSSSQIK